LPAKPLKPLPSFGTGASAVEWFFHSTRAKRKR
jgi:hypothetical protein